jgi:hypothetical protein
MPDSDPKPPPLNDRTDVLPRTPGQPPEGWLPPLPQVQPQEPLKTPWGFMRRASMRIRPLHLLLGGVGSALLGAAIVLAVVAVVARQAGWFHPYGANTNPGPAAAQASAPALPVTRSEQGAGPRVGRARPEADRAHRERAASAKAPANEALTKEEIVAVVKQNAQSLGACIDAARNHDKLPTGPATLLVDFTILPSGAVKSAELKSPDWVLKTSLPGCFSLRIRGWRFPPSASTAPVKNLPLPVTF